MADTSILIDFFRKTDKTKSLLVSLARDGYSFCISAITEYEIYSGATSAQIPYWEEFLERVNVMPFDKLAAKTAVEIDKSLKAIRKQIDTADLFIAAIAMSNNMLFATLNKKHFERIKGLNLLK